MAVVIGDYSFSGPFSRPEEVEETQGVYVVLAEDLGDEENEPTSELEIVEVGFANNLRRELIDHEDQDQWNVLYEGRLFAAVLYADEHPEVSVKNVFASIQPGMFAQPLDFEIDHDPEDEDENDEDDDDDDNVVFQLSLLAAAVEKVAV